MTDYSTYRDLYDLIRRARELRPRKHIILAAYLRAFHPDARLPCSSNRPG